MTELSVFSDSEQLSHRFSGKTPVEDIIHTMKELVQYAIHLSVFAMLHANFLSAGKAKYLGVSECGVDTLRRAVRIHPIQAYQIEYSPFSKDIEIPEVGLLATCRELGIATVAYSPLGRGILTGQYRSVDDFDEGDFRRTIPRFSTQENFDKNLVLVDVLKKIADRKHCTPAQLTLAWMMKQGPDIFAIPGTKKIKYLEENLGAYNVSLTKEEGIEVRRAIDNAEVTGSRVAEHLMGALIMDTPPLTN